MKLILPDSKRDCVDKRDPGFSILTIKKSARWYLSILMDFSYGYGLTLKPCGRLSRTCEDDRTSLLWLGYTVWWIWKDLQIKSLMEPSYTVGGNVQHWRSHCEKQYGDFSKNWNYNCHMTQQISWIYIQKNQKLIWKDICTPVFIAVLFTVSKNGSNLMSINRWIISNIEDGIYIQWNTTQA